MKENKLGTKVAETEYGWSQATEELRGLVKLLDKEREIFTQLHSFFTEHYNRDVFNRDTDKPAGVVYHDRCEYLQLDKVKLDLNYLSSWEFIVDMSRYCHVGHPSKELTQFLAAERQSKKKEQVNA